MRLSSAGDKTEAPANGSFGGSTGMARTACGSLGFASPDFPGFAFVATLSEGRGGPRPERKRTTGGRATSAL